MGNRIDIGAYFEKLAKRGKGGRRKIDEPVPAPPVPGKALPGGDAVAIEYSPNRDDDPDPGEVVWTWVPYEEDQRQGKDRPVVVIGRRGSKLVGIPLTSKPDEREAQVNVGTGGWDPKQRVSYARIWRMLDIDAHNMRREGSVLDRRRFDAVVAAVDHYYDVTYPAKSTSNGTTGSTREAPDF
jgi:hypothetical protein